MSTTKKYLKSKPLCKVTFKLAKQAGKQAEEVALVGEFNAWNTNDIKMKKLKDGSFSTTISLEPGKKYQYRYLLDNAKWENDWEADSYIPNGISKDENSVVKV